MKENINLGFPILVMNTDRIEKKGMHWWSFLNTHQKKTFFYLTVLVSAD